METKKTAKSYSPEVKERAVRMVLEHQGEHASQWTAIGSIAAKIGCGGGNLRKWLRQHERAAGLQDGMTSEMRDRLNPDSPDEMAFGQLRTPISVVRSTLYAGSSSRILTDPTGERRNRQFRQRFPGLRSCRPNPSGESGLT